MRPKIGLMDDDSSITVNETRVMTGLAETSNIVSPNELVCDPLNPINTLLGPRRLSGLYPRSSMAGR